MVLLQSRMMWSWLRISSLPTRTTRIRFLNGSKSFSMSRSFRELKTSLDSRMGIMWNWFALMKMDRYLLMLSVPNFGNAKPSMRLMFLNFKIFFKFLMCRGRMKTFKLLCLKFFRSFFKIFTPFSKSLKEVESSRQITIDFKKRYFSLFKIKLKFLFIMGM